LNEHFRIWWSEGDLPDPGEPVDYRKYLHTYFQALLESMGDAELIFLL